MKNTISALTVTAALLAGLAANSMAADREACNGPPPGPPHAGRLIKTLESLGLSTEQKQQVNTVLKDNEPTVRPLVKKFVAERRQLRTIIHTEPVDDAAIRTQITKIASLEADMAINRAHIGQKIRTILTPEQRQNAEELFKKADARIDRFMHGGFEQIEAE